MNRNITRWGFSLGLILLGVLILLNNLNLLPFEVNGSSWFWVSVFGLLGMAFLLVFVSSVQRSWWAVIPAFTLLGLAFLVGGFSPRGIETQGGFGPAVFLGMIGLSFWVIYFVQPLNWWAIIPGGSLLSVAAVVIVASIPGGANQGIASAAVFFLGMALTFLLVFLRRVDGSRMNWALWPMAALGLIGVLFLVGMSNLVNYLWAVLIILAGVIITVRGLRRR